jgi:uncharacterized protein
MTDTAMILSILVLILSNIVGGIAAFGGALVALPFLILILTDLQLSVFLVVCMGLIQSLHILWYTYKDIHRRELIWILTFGVMGVPLGLLVPTLLPAVLVYTVLAVLIGVTGVRNIRSSLSSSEIQHPNRPALWLRIMMLIGTGVVHGAFGTGGAVLILYSQLVLHTKENFRATLTAVWVCLNLTMFIIFLIQGEHRSAGIYILLYALPGLLIGNWFAQWIATRLNQLRFFQFTALLLIISGIALLIKAWAFT